MCVHVHAYFICLLSKLVYLVTCNFLAFISAEASVQTKPITTSKHIVDPTALAEVQGVFEKPGVQYFPLYMIPTYVTMY